MKHKALIRQLQISCLGLDPIDPLRLLVDDVVAALAQTKQQELVAYWKEHAQGLQRDYDSLLADFQAQRTWVGLTDEDIEQLHTAWVLGGGFLKLCDAIEAKLKERNT